MPGSASSAAGLAATARAARPDTVWMTTESGVDGLPDFDALTAAAAPLANAVTEDDEAPAEILFTSGTTASPKGCVHTHRGLSLVAPLITSTVGFTSEERFLLSMPIWHAAPLNDWLLTMIFLGATTVLQREYDPAGFVAAVERHRATAFFGAPIAYLAPVQLARQGKLSLADADLSSVDKWLYGGAPLGAETARALATAYRSDRFFQVYGMSEMGPVGTALYPHEQVAKAGSIGRGGMPGVDLRVVAPDGNDVPAGGTGEIWLRADTRMSGFHQNAPATAAVFTGPWFRTGDVARVDEDGYLYIVDRLKDLIIVGGENVHSQEVEETLRGHPRLTDVAVVGRPHPEWGETVIAVCVTADGQPITLEEIRGYLGDKLARYKLPARRSRFRSSPQPFGQTHQTRHPPEPGDLSERLRTRPCSRLTSSPSPTPTATDRRGCRRARSTRGSTGYPWKVVTSSSAARPAVTWLTGAASSA